MCRPRTRRLARGAEFVVLFFGLVGGYALLGSPGSPIPVLLVAGGLAFWYLRRAGDVDRRDPRRPEAVRPRCGRSC